ncbi:helicase POLQ-like [Saccoglossus kowalevskii]|uniref:Helicase POLQ-like n=1 Tax=Saccoglossus kowalevskii TaxID=10224 RepID=A0ABM0N075_SACKO|nr:PREDICTED: helicase POLQ-like [Saccoglossus kowalevskii]
MSLQRKVKKRCGSHQRVQQIKRIKHDNTLVDKEMTAPVSADGIDAPNKMIQCSVHDGNKSNNILYSGGSSQIQCKKPLFRKQVENTHLHVDGAKEVDSVQLVEENECIFPDLTTSTPCTTISKGSLSTLPTESPVINLDTCNIAITDEKHCHRELSFVAENTDWDYDDSSFFANVDLSNIVAECNGKVEDGVDITNVSRKEIVEQCNKDGSSKNSELPSVSHTSDCVSVTGIKATLVSETVQTVDNKVHVLYQAYNNNNNMNIWDKTDNSSINCKQSVVTTPVSRLTMKDRIKQRLQYNAKIETPQQNKLMQLKQATIQEAITIAKKMEEKVTDGDIGPFYGLPSKVKELLKMTRGIDKLYDWQNSCLTLPAVTENKNLIYSLPTSGGKTLVAEILIMQQLLCNKRDALLILPFVSIVQEKVRNLSQFALELGFLVEEYAGSKGAMPPRKRRKKQTLYIATIEKAHSLVNCLIAEKRIDNIGLAVVDELHMLGEGGRRGAALEMVLTKLLFVKTTQIIGMSATLNNIEDLQQFLHAQIYTSNFRPVELKEYVKVEDSIFEIKSNALFKLYIQCIFSQYYKGAILQEDPDHLLGLVLEVIPNHSCLVFCSTKRNCQHVAEMLCRHMSRKIMDHKRKEKKELLESLKRECEDNVCSTLRRTIPYGIAYHHSGLTMDERKLIEDSYSEGTLCLLTSTSTLTAGVNLHIKCVILRSPYIANHFLSGSQYKQMVGRAGRAGIDSSGESIMIVKKKDRDQVLELLSSPLESCHSSLLYEDGKGIRSIVLSIVALQLTKTRNDVCNFMKCTLCCVQSLHDIDQQIHQAIDQLIHLGLVKEKTDANCIILEVTKLGHAAFKGSLDIDTCPAIYNDMVKAAENGLVVTNTLHLLYLVTPRDMNENIKIDWMNYYKRFSGLNEVEIKIVEVIGVTESCLARKAAGQKVKQNDGCEQIVARFYLTLMLWYVLKRHSIWVVAAMFDVPRGFLQNLFSSAATFASSLHRFTEDLPEFWAFQHLLGQIVKELSYLATADLVPLLEIPGVKQGRARQLLKAGYKTLNHLAYTSPDELVKKIENMPSKLARQIVAAAKMELNERAEALRELAEEIVLDPTNT